MQEDRQRRAKMPGPAAGRTTGATDPQEARSLFFHSVLFLRPDDSARADAQEAAPDFFRDLNLDQIAASITGGWTEFNLTPFFRTSLRDADAVAYRQEVFRDLESPAVMEAVRSFTERLRVSRRYLNLAKDIYFPHHKEGWLLASACAYCDAVLGLSNALSEAPLTSRALLGFRSFLGTYATSDRFRDLAARARTLAGDLSAIRYTFTIKGNRVIVRPYDGEADYGTAVEETFHKFRQGAVKDYRSIYKGSGMNHVEASILQRVAWLNPSTFRPLSTFCTEYATYPEDGILRFYREIQFYTAFLDYVKRFRHAGLPFCYPTILEGSKEVSSQGAFDPSLAARLLPQQKPVVLNDFFLRDPERVLVVSGPNQGGKTTFARMFGQLHYLASLGGPVPAREARLFLFDRLFTHFEREEDIGTLRGKLEDDLVRVRGILEQATQRSVIVMNEIFASTTLKDASALGKRILERICELDLLCVCVTFLDELAALNEKTVSMVSTVDPENPVIRTFRVVRRPPDGLAYAFALAEKHGVTYAQLKERIKP